MQLLTQQETPILLSLLLSSEEKRLCAVREEFEKAFAAPDRFRACCAAVLLLEDPTILRLPQRITAWYLLSLCDPGSHGTSAFLTYLVKALGNAATPPVERTFLLQLLSGPLPQEVCDSSPRAYAASCDCRALNAADVAALCQRLLASAPRGPALPGPAKAELHRALPDPLPRPRRGLFPAHPLSSSSSTSSALQTSHPATTAAVPAADASRHAAAAALVAACGPVGLAPAWERPAPGVLTPLASELKWLSPDLHGELLWDSTLGETHGSLTHGSGSAAGAAGTARELLSAALRGPLLPAQQGALLAALAADPRVALRAGLRPCHLGPLVEHAPVVAAEVLGGMLGRWPERAQEFLSALACGPMSLHSLEVVNRLTSAGPGLPTEFVHTYIANCIASCEGTQDKYVQNRLVRLVCVFLQSLVRNRLLAVAGLLHEVQAFCINFSRIREAAKLFRLLKQVEAGMRGGGGGGGTGAGGGGEAGGEAGED